MARDETGEEAGATFAFDGDEGVFLKDREGDTS
jgi:hypothetical protein